MNGQRYAEDLEGQNDEALEGLSAKVKLLKDVSEFTYSLSWFQILNECPIPFACSGHFFFLWWLDYNWHWERSARVDNTAEPDGKYGLFTLCNNSNSILKILTHNLLCSITRTMPSPRRAVFFQGHSEE